MPKQIELEGKIHCINIDHSFAVTSVGKTGMGNRDLQIVVFLDSPGAEAKINFATGLCEKQIDMISNMPDDGVDILIKLRRTS